MPPEHNKRAIERVLEAFNTGDLTIIDDVVADQHTDYTPFPGTSADREGLKKQIAHIRQAFPDARFEVEEMIAEGESVAYRWTMEGTQQGSFMGHAANGRRVTHFGHGFVHFRNGKMVSHRSRDGNHTILEKLGHEAVPRPERDPDLQRRR